MQKLIGQVRIIHLGITVGFALLGTVAVLVLFFLYQYFIWSPNILEPTAEVPPRPWGVILGAKVWGDHPSPMLEDRLMTGLDLLRRGKIKKLFLSGGPSVEGVHETLMMHDWLRERGVPESALTLDYSGLSTIQSLRNAQENFNITQPLIVSQKFHLPRVLFLAHHLGIGGYAVVADRREYLDRHFYWIREIGAMLKAAHQIYHPSTTFFYWVRSQLGSPSKKAAIQEGRLRIKEIFQKQGLSYPPQDVLLVGIKSAKKLLVFIDQKPRSQPSENPLIAGHSSVDEERSWTVLKKYPVLASSGALGPKLREGDRQVPEGVYRVTYKNEQSRFHLALRLNYPNEYDQSQGVLDERDHLGGDIMIHGSDVSVGCLAIGNSGIEEIYALAADTNIDRWRVILMPTWPSNFPQLKSESEIYPKWYPDLLDKIHDEIVTINLSLDLLKGD